MEPATGKRKTLTQRKNEGKKEFKDRFTKVMNDINQRTYIETSKDTFIQILEKHIEQKHKDNLTGDSSYDRDLYTKKQIEKTYNNFINKPIQKISIDDVENAKDEIRKYSNNSINKIWRLLYKTFNISTTRRKIPYNPMDNNTLNKPVSHKKTKIIKALTVSEKQNQEKGIPLVVIQAIVGHIEGSSVTEDVYTTVTLDFMKNELRKIGE